MIETYGYTSCTSCRKTNAQLSSAGAEFSYRDYFKERFTAEELADLLARTGLTPHGLLSHRSKVYQARSAEIDGMSGDALAVLMLEEPTLLRRPFVIGPDGQVVVGHNEIKLDQVIAADCPSRSS